MIETLCSLSGVPPYRGPSKEVVARVKKRALDRLNDERVQKGYVEYLAKHGEDLGDLGSDNSPIGEIGGVPVYFDFDHLFRLCLRTQVACLNAASGADFAASCKEFSDKVVAIAAMSARAGFDQEWLERSPSVVYYRYRDITDGENTNEAVARDVMEIIQKAGGTCWAPGTDATSK